MTKSTPQAIAAFQATQLRYGDFGAQDTEPRTEFVLMLERVAEGKDPVIPHGHDWQLFSSMPGHLRAAAALTRSARGVVRAAAEDYDGLLEWLKHNYGYEPF